MTEGGYAQGNLIISTGTAEDSTVHIVAPVITEAYKRIGITIEIKNSPWPRALKYANRGITDGKLFRAAVIQKENPNLLMVKIPVANIDFVVFTKDIRFNVTGWESLSPYRINFVRGIKKIENNTRSMHVGTVTEIDQALKKLQSGTLRPCC